MSKSVKIIYYVHGTTYDNELKICSGWKDVELSELGKRQAFDLGKKTSYSFDVLYSSDLIRAVDTASLAFPNIEKYQDKRLRECNYGDYNGKDKNLAVYEEHITEKFPNGESLKDVEYRVRSFLNFLLENYEGKTVGIISHKAPQFAIEVITKNISFEEAIKNDWRKSKLWKPGWEYIVTEECLNR